MSKSSTPEGPVKAGGPRRRGYARFLHLLLTVSIIGLAKFRWRPAGAPDSDHRIEGLLPRCCMQTPRARARSSTRLAARAASSSTRLAVGGQARPDPRLVAGGIALPGPNRVGWRATTMSELFRLMPPWTFAALVGGGVLALLILAFRVERPARPDGDRLSRDDTIFQGRPTVPGLDSLVRRF